MTGVRFDPVTETVIAEYDGDPGPVPDDIFSTVAPPSNPMAVARQFVMTHFMLDGELVLRDHRGDLYRYDGSSWPEVDRRDVRAGAYRWLENAVYESSDGDKEWEPTRHKIDNVLDALRAIVNLDGSSEPPCWTEQSAWPPSEIVSMRNGLLHVPTRELLPHTPRFFCHHALAFDFDALAGEPTQWLRFLDEVWDGDESSIECLQETFGYILGGDTRQQKMFILVGPRRGGKGTIGRVLTGLLGPHNVAAPTLAGMAADFGLAPLIGKPLALISDARLGKGDSKIVVERLLSVSGEDSISVNRKYRDHWTGRLPARFVILTNELPQLTDSSGALASRFVIFVLTKSWLGREDPALTDKLLAEAPAIFNWALEGLDRLNERGRFSPPASGAEAMQQLEDLASPVTAFIRERCVLGTDDRSVEVDALWAAWKAWCEEQNRGIGAKAVFGRDLRAAAPAIRKQRAGTDVRIHRYSGIAIRDNSGELL